MLVVGLTSTKQGESGQVIASLSNRLDLRMVDLAQRSRYVNMIIICQLIG